MENLSGPRDLMIELPVFSGPFRLMADLVLDQKVDVCDVPLARVTERFVAEGADALAGWSLEEATWFLATCAVLLEMKVGRLLPRSAPDLDEDLLGTVSPDLIYARTLELAAFRRAAENLTLLMEEAALLVPRPSGSASQFAHLYPDPLERVDADAIAALARVALAPPAIVDLTHVTPIRFTLADALASLRTRLRGLPETRFRDLVGDCQERIEVVVRFLALLELYREGKVELRQAGPLGDIEVRWHREAA